jgi:prepilin-type N-terminal cleavage/methylation domain-containing protein
MHRRSPGRARVEGRSTHARGFTLVELMITVTVLALVVVVLMMVMYGAQRSKVSTVNQIESAQAARAAMDLMVRDLRSAGYGADLDNPSPQTPLAYIDSLQVLINANLEPYPDTSVARKPPQSYNPAGNPQPFPLAGTAWQPPLKYTKGAEVIRWTLDTNNDGAVDGSDVADPEGEDAAHTPNPNDFVLVREVYGDSTGDVAGNNGGVAERVGLVRRPGSGVPPLFTVYLAGSSTPWNWSSGPLPAAMLGDVERIVVNVVAPSARADARGKYAETRLKTEVNSLRNVPDFGTEEYNVYGNVFDDRNEDGDQDAGEAGLAGVAVRLGPSFSAFTNASGSFFFRAPAGTYTLRHTPPAGYGVFTSPDSFMVTVGPHQNRSFADTARAGGWVTAEVFEDVNENDVKDGSEPWRSNVKVRMDPGGETKYTNASGQARLFASVGGYSVTVTAPDSFALTTTNPMSGTMANGGSATVRFGIAHAEIGTIKGMVFRDTDKDGMYDLGEPGMQNVYVAVTPDGGATIAGYQFTDNLGNYSIDVPANNPPGDKPYHVTCLPPAGFFPTTPTSLGPILISGGQTITGKNFGFAPYSTITLNATRVLSLATRDLIEKDWNGNKTDEARKDTDLLLGADAGATDNISVWFNDYDVTPLFGASPTYTRNAPGSVLAMAVDALDSGSPTERPDVVTGTRNNATGNFFVWLDQNTSGNLGYLPPDLTTVLKYRTQNAGDVQAVVTLDCAGGAMPDIVVGTKSPTAGQGTFEVWTSNDAATPTYTRDEIYPPAGSIPGNAMGEVTAMALADFNLDGKKDLVVGTRTGSYSGELLVFKNVSKTTGNRFKLDFHKAISGAAVTCLVAAPVSVDASPDIVIGTQTGIGTGTLQLWQYDIASPLNLKFDMVKEVSAPGIVASVAYANLGGTLGRDIVMGWRQNETSYVGGPRVYFNDFGTLPASGSDPSGGNIANWVPALTVGNFNYGVKPVTPSPPYLTDFAAGVKVTSTTGALVVFVR